MFRNVSIEEVWDACSRIDPNTEDLADQVKLLTDQGYSVGVALVKIAEDQPIPLRKPVASAPPADETKSRAR